MTIDEVFRNTDWAELRKQKRNLSEIQASLTVPQNELIEGLLSFLDRVQDAAVFAGFPVHVVFEEATLEDSESWYELEYSPIGADDWHAYGNLYRAKTIDRIYELLKQFASENMRFERRAVRKTLTTEMLSNV